MIPSRSGSQSRASTAPVAHRVIRYFHIREYRVLAANLAKVTLFRWFARLGIRRGYGDILQIQVVPCGTYSGSRRTYQVYRVVVSYAKR